MAREASCSCGDLRVTCQGEPELVSLCHCIECQKRTGSPFGIASFYPRQNIKVVGRYSSFARSSDQGFATTFHFCGNCGSTVFWEPSRKPHMIAVGVGSFGDPEFPGPTQEVHTDCRHGWVKPL
ncbi:GFA family protein [Mariluticola halotolerans]|uniref:GFA family protein n=1 Tax=Mariluticola halotolerans TaxID=2909283 RepID=UPI0026E2A5FC|nr:GFA family protein [Mariluticola halotolerans]UJQ95604.1 GFA family protein [Mariluticola halotolerans]